MVRTKQLMTVRRQYHLTASDESLLAGMAQRFGMKDRSTAFRMCVREQHRRDLGNVGLGALYAKVKASEDVAGLTARGEGGRVAAFESRRHIFWMQQADLDAIRAIAKKHDFRTGDEFNCAAAVRFAIRVEAAIQGFKVPKAVAS